MFPNQYWSPPNQTTWPPYQQQAPNIYRPTIPGRTVNSIEEITPNDVPMDGTAGLYLLKDMSAVYAKAWNSDGTIQTVRYVPDTSKQENKPDPMKIILERLDKIEELVSKKSQNFKPQNNKEVKPGV